MTDKAELAATIRDFVKHRRGPADLQLAIAFTNDKWETIAAALESDAREAAPMQGPSADETELAAFWANMPDDALDRINIVGLKKLARAVLRWKGLAG